MPAFRAPMEERHAKRAGERRRQLRGWLVAASDGWYAWHQEPAIDAVVLVRFRAASRGRLKLAGLHIDDVPTARLLRAIPVGRIEATANTHSVIVDHPTTGPRPLRRPTTSTSPDVPSPRDSADAPHGTAVPPPTAVRRTRGRPDTFYQHIAEVYRRLARQSARPAVDLAVQHDVPVTTAHRWIKEARRRGHLAAGRVGKVG